MRAIGLPAPFEPLPDGLTTLFDGPRTWTNLPGRGALSLRLGLRLGRLPRYRAFW